MDLYDAFYNLAKINKIELSQKASMTSKSTLKYFEEKCGRFNKLQDQDEIIEAIKKDKVPYIDIISRDSIYPDNIIYINDRCYDKIQMKEWALSFKDKTAKPKTPDTGVELTLEDIESLCLDPSIFTYTYAKEDLNLDSRLQNAVVEDNLKQVKYLVEKGADVNSKDNVGITSLMVASLNGNLEIVEYLIEQGADINIVDNLDKSALTYAILNNDLNTVKYLVEHNAGFDNIELNIAKKKSKKTGNTTIMDYLVKKSKGNELEESEDDFENPILPESEGSEGSEGLEERSESEELEESEDDFENPILPESEGLEERSESEGLEESEDDFENPILPE